MCFLVTFCTMQKVTTRSLCREHRGFPNLESAHSKQQIRTNKIRPFWNFSRFCKPRFSSPQWRLRTNKIKTFCRFAASLAASRFFSAYGGVPSGTARSAALSLLLPQQILPLRVNMLAPQAKTPAKATLLPASLTNS